MYVVICKIDHCIHIHWCIVMGLGHNDPWVESHMWPQQTWGQRSSRGQWPLVQVFGKKGKCIHVLWCILKSIKYYNDCKSMWSRKQARLVVREPPCLGMCTPVYLSGSPGRELQKRFKKGWLKQHMHVSMYLKTHKSSCECNKVLIDILAKLSFLLVWEKHVKTHNSWFSLMLKTEVILFL